MAVKKSSRTAGTIGAAALGLALICALAATTLIVDRKTEEDATVQANAAEVVEVASAPVKATQPVARKVAVVRSQAPRPAAAVHQNAPADAVPAMTRQAETAATDRVAGETAPAMAAAVTISGCLEQDDEKFRLKETSGADAPKSRSWKSGFLKKGSATIELLDAANRFALPSHVGERVSVTGMLVDKEMQMASIDRVAASCD
jgi:hypothetical protein